MKSNKNKPLTIWQKIHKYRAKIGLLAFIIVIPLVLIISIYLGPYLSNKSVHFDQEHTDVQRHFIGVDDLDKLSIFVNWTTLKKPQYSVDNPSIVETHGSYGFNVRYEAKGLYDITSVKITPVLHTDWFSYYSVGAQRVLSTNSGAMDITWDEVFPMHKLLFITVNEPNLYLKVEYSYIALHTTITETAYMMYSLKDLIPTQVS